jgi:hypothetical protein
VELTRAAGGLDGDDGGRQENRGNLPGPEPGKADAAR